MDNNIKVHLTKNILNYKYWYLFILLFCIFIIYTISYSLWFPLGDDISYALTLSSVDGPGTGIYPIWKYPWACARHWFFVNGRMANYFAIFFLGLFPQIINSILTSGMIIVNIILILKLSGVWLKNNRYTLAFFGIFIYMITFSWWDSMFFLDVAYNYIWATGMTLIFLWLLKYQGSEIKNRLWKVLAVVFSVFAGCMHEACTCPIVASILIYLWIHNYLNKQNWRKISLLKRQMFVAYSIGAIFCVLSPGIWMRTGRLGEPDDVLWLLLLKSVPLTLIMAAILLILCLFQDGRKWIWSQIHSEIGILIFASLFSVCFVCVGGIVGRSGWFSQTFSLIVMLRWSSNVKFRICMWLGGIASLLMSVIIIIQGYFVDAELNSINKQEQKLLNLYLESTDGIVYFNSPDCSKLPWWILGRIRCFKDDDDYTRSMLANYYHKPKIVVLPEELKGIDLKCISFNDKILDLEVYLLSNGDCISEALPTNAIEPEKNWYNPDIATFEYNGHRWSAIKFDIEGKSYYRLMPHYFDAGDR